MKEKQYDGNTVEHLRMLQGIISRMANTSLGIKRYSLMIFTFVCGYLIISQIAKSIYLLFLAIFIFIAMLFFDMYYLNMERAYRNKFDENRENPIDLIVFDLSIDKISFTDYVKTFFSKSIYLFYAPLLILMIILYLLA